MQIKLMESKIFADCIIHFIHFLIVAYFNIIEEVIEVPMPTVCSPPASAFGVKAEPWIHIHHLVADKARA